MELHPDKNNLREKDYLISWDIVHHGKKAWRQKYEPTNHIVFTIRKHRQAIACAQHILSFLFISGPQPTLTVLLTVKICPSTLIN